MVAYAAKAQALQPLPSSPPSQSKKTGNFAGLAPSVPLTKNDVAKVLGWKRSFQRDDELLRAVGFSCKDMKPDGACLFRAFSDQLEGDGGNNHMMYRNSCVDYIEAHPQLFQHFITGDFKEYCGVMRQPTEWGGEVEIEALCRAFVVNATIHRPDGAETLEDVQKSAMTVQHHHFDQHACSVQVCFHPNHKVGPHYSSVYVLGDDGKSKPNSAAILDNQQNLTECLLEFEENSTLPTEATPQEHLKQNDDHVETAADALVSVEDETFAKKPTKTTSKARKARKKQVNEAMRKAVVADNKALEEAESGQEVVPAELQCDDKENGEQEQLREKEYQEVSHNVDKCTLKNAEEEDEPTGGDKQDLLVKKGAAKRAKHFATFIKLLKLRKAHKESVKEEREPWEDWFDRTFVDVIKHSDVPDLGQKDKPRNYSCTSIPSKVFLPRPSWGGMPVVTRGGQGACTIPQGLDSIFPT